MKLGEYSFVSRKVPGMTGPETTGPGKISPGTTDRGHLGLRTRIGISVTDRVRRCPVRLLRGVRRISPGRHRRAGAIFGPGKVRLRVKNDSTRRARNVRLCAMGIGPLAGMTEVIPGQPLDRDHRAFAPMTIDPEPVDSNLLDSNPAVLNRRGRSARLIAGAIRAKADRSADLVHPDRARRVLAHHVPAHHVPVHHDLDHHAATARAAVRRVRQSDRSENVRSPTWRGHS